jgi:hypothetical protein
MNSTLSKVIGISAKVTVIKALRIFSVYSVPAWLFLSFHFALQSDAINAVVCQQ